MKNTHPAMWITLLLLVVAGIAFIATSRAGYETAQYKVIKQEGNFEIREYETLTVVSTPMNGGAQNKSFGRLFGYISGANEKKQKIAMTTPVFMPSNEQNEPQEMQFVVPLQVAADGAPAPDDPGVKKVTMSGGQYAALRFNGYSSAEDRKKKLGELQSKITALGLTSTGTAIYAGYDPPWTPGPTRRNEVLLKLKNP